jgi:hypothetical protein
MGKPNGMAGYMVKVYDAETSEEIENILKIDVTLRPSSVTTATITYVEYGPHGEMLHDAEGKCIEDNVVVENPSLNLTAYELAGDDGDQA